VDLKKVTRSGSPIQASNSPLLLTTAAAPKFTDSINSPLLVRNTGENEGKFLIIIIKFLLTSFKNISPLQEIKIKISREIDPGY
jgi:hypothetical protein